MHGRSIADTLKMAHVALADGAPLLVLSGLPHVLSLFFPLSIIVTYVIVLSI